jgi:hypothetical protein
MKLLAAVALSAALVVSYASRAQAQCMSCTTASDQSSVSVTGAWGFGCVPGFVLANDNANGSASISMSVGASSLSIEQTFASDTCCVAPYANIGIFDGCQASDQYGQAGSHLPIQLKNLAMLEGAWTFQVPYPLNPNASVEQYRVYFEIFLSQTATGKADAGNLTVVFFWNNFSFDAASGHAPINGPQGMDYIDYGGTVGQGQGPFVDFLYPQGTFTPDGTGTVTVHATDVKAVLDWAVQKFPKYYTGDLYLSSLSLAEEAAALHGTVKTSYASFAVQATGSPVVYTPPFTADHWTADAGTASEGGSSSGSPDAAAGGTQSDAGSPSADAGKGGSGGGGGAADATAPADGGAGNGASPGETSSSGGCTLATGTRSSAATWMGLGALALVGLRRRRCAPSL